MNTGKLPKPHPLPPAKQWPKNSTGGVDLSGASMREIVEYLYANPLTAAPVYHVLPCTSVSVYRVRPEEPRASECPKCGAPIALRREPVTCSYCRWVVRPA